MIIFGTIGIFRTYIPVGSATLAVLRGFIGAAAVLIIMLIIRKKVDFSAVKRNLPLLIISGILIGINWVLLFEAYNYTTVAVATLCYYMAPIFVITVSPFLLGEKITLKKIICIVTAVTGMVLISGILNTGGYLGIKGVLLGLGAAVIYAGVIVINKKIKDLDPYSKTVIQLFFAALATLPYAVLKENTDFSSLSVVSVVLILVVCIVHTGIAYAMYFGAMDNIPAQTVALFSYIDPIVAVFGSFFLLKQPLGIAEIIGIVLILCASVALEIKPIRK